MFFEILFRVVLNKYVLEFFSIGGTHESFCPFMVLVITKGWVSKIIVV
jgi:hypothetical protein